MGSTDTAYIHLLLQRNSSIHSLPHHRKAFLRHSKLHPPACQRAGPGPWRTQALRGRGGAVPLCAVKLYCWQTETEKVSHRIYTVLWSKGIKPASQICVNINHPSIAKPRVQQRERPLALEDSRSRPDRLHQHHRNYRHQHFYESPMADRGRKLASSRSGSVAHTHLYLPVFHSTDY